MDIYSRKGGFRIDICQAVADKVRQLFHKNNRTSRYGCILSADLAVVADIVFFLAQLLPQQGVGG